MKKIYFTLLLLSATLIKLNAQDNVDISGVWQWKKDGKNMKVSDFGYQQYKNHQAFQVFTSDGKMFLAFALSQNEINEAKMASLISKQEAMEGTYTMDENTVKGDIGGNPFTFIYVPETKKMKTGNDQVNIELVRIKKYGSAVNANNTIANDNDHNVNNAVIPAGGVGSAGDGYYGDEYYGGAKRKIMVAPDGSRYYLGPSGRKVYVYKNGQVKIKSDAEKKASAPVKKSTSTSVKSSGSGSYYAPRSRGGRRK